MMINQGFRALCAAALLGAASAGFAAADELVLPSEVAATHWKTDYQNEFAQKVGERTGGALDVKGFPAGQLYNEQDALAALGTGAVHMVWPVSVRLESIEPATGVLNLPFALSDEMMLNSCFNKGLTPLISGYVDPRNLKVLGFLRTADLLFIFKDREVAKMEDLAGTKVRVTGGRVFQDTMKTLQVSPVSMAASEMSTAMSQGAIDGVFTSPAGWAEMIGITGNHAWYVPGFSLSTYAVVVDKGWFEALPADQQAAINDTIAEIADRQWNEAKAADEKLIEKMKAEGAVVHVAEGAELQRWRDMAAANAGSFTEAHGDVVKALAELEASCGLGG